MSDPQNLEGDRYDTMAAEIVTECIDTGKAGLAGWELASLQDAIGNALRTRLAEVEAENGRLRNELANVCNVTGYHSPGARAALAQTTEKDHDDG